MDKSLLQVLGEDRADEVRDAIRDLVIGQVEEDLGSEYIVDLGSLTDFSNEIMAELKTEIKNEIKEKIKEKVLNNVLKEFNL